VNTRTPNVVHAASGILCLLLFLSTILVLPPIPPFGSSQAQIVEFYATYATRGYVYQLIAGVALLSALWFLGYLYTRLRREAPGSPLPAIMLSSGTAWITFAVVYLGMFQIFSVWAGQPETWPILRAFSDAYVLGFMFSAVPAAVTTAAASMCLRRCAGWPGWLKPLGVLAVLAQVLGCVPLVAPDGPVKAGGPVTYASVFTVVLWICVASIAAVRVELTAARRHQHEAFSQA